MEYSKEMLSEILTQFKIVQAAQLKSEAASKAYHEAVQKLKVHANLTGENNQKIIDAAVLMIGHETIKLGGFKEE